MTPKNQQLQRLIDGGVVAIIRAETSAGLLKVVEAIEKGGVKTIQIRRIFK